MLRLSSTRVRIGRSGRSHPTCQIPNSFHSALNPKELVVQVVGDVKSIHEHLQRPVSQPKFPTSRHNAYALIEAVFGASKIALGSATHNPLLVASGAQSASIFVFGLFRIFSKRYSVIPCDGMHPYGHSKIDALTGSFAALIYLYAAVRSAMLILPHEHSHAVVSAVTSATTATTATTTATAAATAATTAATSSTAAATAVAASASVIWTGVAVAAVSAVVAAGVALALRHGRRSEVVISQRASVGAVCSAVAAVVTAGVALGVLPAAATTYAAGAVIGVFGADAILALRDGCFHLIDKGLDHSHPALVAMSAAAQRVEGVASVKVVAARSDEIPAVDAVISVQVLPAVATAADVFRVTERVREAALACAGVTNVLVEIHDPAVPDLPHPPPTSGPAL